MDYQTLEELGAFLKQVPEGNTAEQIINVFNGERKLPLSFDDAATAYHYIDRQIREHFPIKQF
jgi:hypothetical protein